MNDLAHETVFADYLKKSVQPKKSCSIEIRAVAASEGRVTADRLLANLRMGGLQAEVVEVTSAPRADILIESSHQCAEIALGLQSAFLAAGAKIELLVHNKPNPKQIILHLAE